MIFGRKTRDTQRTAFPKATSQQDPPKDTAAATSKTTDKSKPLSSKGAADAYKKAVEESYTTGLRDVRTTTLFRVTNFELFVKPNVIVMGLGLVAITGCVAFLAYMNATQENKQYYAENEDGTSTLRKKTSRWD